MKSIKLTKLNNIQKKILIFGLVLMAMGGGIEKLVKFYMMITGYEVHFNRTQSLPQAFWILNTNAKSNFKQGDYFMFLAPHNTMLTEGESTPLVKKIAGVAGDTVSIHKTSILINNKVMGHLWPKTSRGHILTPIESQIIARGCYFAWTEALYSYDSRYTDVGLVCESQNRILGLAKPLF